MRPRREGIGLIALIFFFILFGIGFAVQTSTFNAPDERGHYLYLEYVHETGLLPVLSAESPNKEAHQPPLYYWISQPVFALTQDWDERSHILALRFFSLLLSAGVVMLTYASIRRLFPDRQILALLATTFVALNPQFIFMSSVINNDALTNLMGAFWIYVVVVLCTSSSEALLQRRYQAGVVALAIGMFFTKSSLWPLIVLLFLTQLFHLPPGKRLHALLCWLPFGVVILWWLSRNTILYGDPAVHDFQRELWYAEQHRDFLSVSGVWNWFVTLAESFWARFAYFNIALPGVFYLFVKVGMLLGAIGFLRYLYGHWRARMQAKLQALWIFLLGALSVCLGVFWYSLSFYQPQGRYLFAVIPALMLFLSLGLLSFLPRRLHWILVVLVFIGLILADVKSYALLSKYG